MTLRFKKWRVFTSCPDPCATKVWVGAARLSAGWFLISAFFAQRPMACFANKLCSPCHISFATNCSLYL